MSSGIYKRTDFHKQISCQNGFQKGLVPWNKGTKGICKPNITSFKVGESRHRTPHSEETKDKISKSKKGKSPNRIYSVSLETREKIRKTLRKGLWQRCVICGEPFYSSPTAVIRGTKYCSRGCYGVANSGENNCLWNGGTSRAYKTGYYSQQYKNWRKEVFKRDNYECRKCGAIGYITAHHIKSFAHHPELRFDIDNGLTLCEKCHSLTDNYRGKAKRRKNGFLLEI